jgi:hypothetical protein
VAAGAAGQPGIKRPRVCSTPPSTTNYEPFSTTQIQLQINTTTCRAAETQAVIAEVAALARRGAALAANKSYVYNLSCSSANVN